MEGLGLSERRACLLIGVSSSVYRYETKRGNDYELRTRMRELSWGKEAVWQSQAAHHAQEGGIGGQPQADRAYLQGRRGLAYGERGVVRAQQEPG